MSDSMRPRRADEPRANFAAFADHVKDVQQANAAQKEGIVGDALRVLETASSQLLAHLENPKTLARLHGCAPPLQEAVVLVIIGMFMSKGERLFVHSGVRSEKEQHDLYSIGRDPKRPGKIVTHIDGIKKRSNHQAAVDGPWRGLGLAVDLVFLDDKGAPSWAEEMPWRLLGSLAKAQGLVWGGDWPTLRDRPHVELMA